MGDILQNSCFKSVLNELKYACESVFIKVAGYRSATLSKYEMKIKCLFTNIHKQ